MLHFLLMDCKTQKPLGIHLISSTDSPEFTHLTRTLARSSVVGLDAEWKPIRGNHSTFPTVTLLQLACQLRSLLGGDSTEPIESDDSVVFLLDLTSIDIPSIWEFLRELFVSPDILKLGFRFKQDLVYLSSTFSEHGCNAGFDKVEPYLDITSIYNHMQYNLLERKTKDIKSLAAICKEVLNISLSKELQCSDWSHRPLTEEQEMYAAMDALCLIQIFDVFKAKLGKEGESPNDTTEHNFCNLNLGLKGILEKGDVSNGIIVFKLCKASDVVRATASSENSQRITEVGFKESCRITMPMDKSLLKIVRKYGEKLKLAESDRAPKSSKRKGKKRSKVAAVNREKLLGISDDWQGPPPWDLSLGGDGCPKFLCDVMVEGLAKHLRCVGIDAAVPKSKKLEARELIDQAYKEKRVLLTRDAKLLRHQYLLINQIYRVKSLLKNEQLLEDIQTFRDCFAEKLKRNIRYSDANEKFPLGAILILGIGTAWLKEMYNSVIEIFQLKIDETQLMSRCTKCNGNFIQKPLTTEEAIEAAKGFQRIPNCLFDKNLEFWQCMDCNQLYWEGTQYHNALQKFIDVCKLNQVTYQQGVGLVLDQT